MLLEHVDHGHGLDLDVARVVVVHDLGARRALLGAHDLLALKERDVLGRGDAGATNAAGAASSALAGPVTWLLTRSAAAGAKLSITLLACCFG